MLLNYQAIIAAAYQARLVAGQDVPRLSCKSVILACLPETTVRVSRKLPADVVAVASIAREPGGEPARHIHYSGTIKDPAAHRLALGQAIGHLLMHDTGAPVQRFEVLGCEGEPRELQRQDRLTREAMLFAFELLLPLHVLDRFFEDAPLFPRGDEADEEFEGRLFSAAGRFALPYWVVRNRARRLQLHRRTGRSVEPQAKPKLQVISGGRS